jgi:hypothetical protein
VTQVRVLLYRSLSFWVFSHPNDLVSRKVTVDLNQGAQDPASVHLAADSRVLRFFTFTQSGDQFTMQVA